jgi:hypothetical protein
MKEQQQNPHTHDHSHHPTHDHSHHHMLDHSHHHDPLVSAGSFLHRPLPLSRRDFSERAFT